MPRPTDTDQALIGRSHQGDHQAFHELFERKHRRIYLIAYQVLGDQAHAEDVVQEVFLKLWEHLADYDETLQLDPWLHRIAHNRAIDHWRSRQVERRHRLHVVGDGEPDRFLETVAADAAGSRGAEDPEMQLSWQQLQAVWDDLAEDLSPQRRAAFVLRCIEEMPTGEVAEALGCSASTVRSHIGEARKTLREGIRSRYPELARDA